MLPTSPKSLSAEDQSPSVGWAEIFLFYLHSTNNSEMISFLKRIIHAPQCRECRVRGTFNARGICTQCMDRLDPISVPPHRLRKKAHRFNALSPAVLNVLRAARTTGGDRHAEMD